MIKITLPILILANSILYSQYSRYYNVNTNSNVNVNANINATVSGNIYEFKTFATIDFGALALANSLNEKNRIENQKFADERQKQIALEIFDDPLKAYDYGSWITVSTKDKKLFDKDNLKSYRGSTGFKEFRLDYVLPHGFLFNILNIFNFQNVSSDGITTEILFNPPLNLKGSVIRSAEESFENMVLGQQLDVVNEQGKETLMYLHKKDLNRATVYSAKGYRGTTSWEDKFEYYIIDHYEKRSFTENGNFELQVIVKYSGDKDEIDFEKLEGRRYYLKALIEKIISTAKISDLEFSK